MTIIVCFKPFNNILATYSEKVILFYKSYRIYIFISSVKIVASVEFKETNRLL